MGASFGKSSFQFDKRAAVALLAIIALAAVLRTWHIADESPWYDETLTLRPIGASGLAEYLAQIRQLNPPVSPGYFSIAYVWSRVVGHGVLAMRLLSLVLGLLSIPLIFALTRLLFNVRAGLYAALFVALSVGHIYYSQEVRMYGLVLLLAVASMYAFYRGVENEHTGWQCVNAALNVLLAYTHLFAPLLVVVQGFYLLTTKRRNFKTIFAWGFMNSAVVLFVVYWFWSTDLHGVQGSTAWVVAPGIRQIYIALLVFAGGGARETTFSVLLVMAMFGLVGLSLFSRLTLQYATMNGAHRGAVLALLWLFVPFILLLAISVLWRPCFVLRYILYTSIPICMLAGDALSSMSIRRQSVIGAAVITLYALELSTVMNRPFRLDWRSLDAYLNEHIQPGDKAILTNLDFQALQYNAPRAAELAICVDNCLEMRQPVLDATRTGHDAWALVRPQFAPFFEEFITTNGLGFSSLEFLGLPNARLYHVSRRSAPTQQTPLPAQLNAVPETIAHDP